ncbi:hypothetical protein [Chryseobacterium profundimaris]|uniref:Uncharacterized protein n=1 Tax=Chryseobacterium profundimaris TaxID=1387275 RepID=A0ABY1NHK1_9FLAO|nr:hypothetical protein [Chryseobacterium profundimaris]SMP09041.1 hypothetical protein SAMN06264346_10221 [Chryseobacterium profundimaris]
MNKQISKITLTAIPKVLTAFLHEIINSNNFKNYDLKVKASYEQTEIFIQKKNGHNIEKEDWTKLLSFVDDKTPGLAFNMLIQYV